MVELQQLKLLIIRHPVKYSFHAVIGTFVAAWLCVTSVAILLNPREFGTYPCCERRVAGMDDELRTALPKCRECMAQLDVAGDEQHPFWWCPSCRVAVLHP